MKKVNCYDEGKSVIAIVEELKKEVEVKYALSGFKPNGFEDNEFDEKIAILADMFEEDEKLGLCEAKSNRAKAYMQLSELYHACGSWN